MTNLKIGYLAEVIRSTIEEKSRAKSSDAYQPEDPEALAILCLRRDFDQCLS